jgi:stage VI sporulation protein D
LSRVRFGFQPEEEDFDEAFQLAKKLLRKPSPDEFGPDRAAADSSAQEETWDEEAGKSEEESAESAEETVSTDVRESEQGTGEEGLHWARQFLGEKEDTFVKMRMVIVQKGESLESLADRYGVSASSILRLNDLESGQLEEGQIVYIPGEERKTAQ